MSTRWYPIYQRGNPQLRIFLPNFWMRLIKPKDEFHPPNRLVFHVSREMTRSDVKSYLEKIYKIPVMTVHTYQRIPKVQTSKYDSSILYQDDPYKVAYVTLPRDFKFSFPDVTEPIHSMEKEDEEKDLEKAKKQYSVNNQLDREGVPPFFGL